MVIVDEADADVLTGKAVSPKAIEALLLRVEARARRRSGFVLEGAMHALVAPVLFGMTSIDPFGTNTETHPLDGELG